MSAGLENSDHRPSVRYKKDVWSWEGLDEWEALEFTRFEALLINISRSDHSTDNGGYRNEIVRIALKNENFDSASKLDI